MLDFSSNNMKFYSNWLHENCMDGLICYYVSSHGYDFQWLYSDTWEFYYHYTGELSNLPHQGRGSPVLENAIRLFNVQFTLREGEAFEEVLRCFSKGNCIFMCGETYYLPFIQQRERGNSHMFAAIKVNEDKTKMLVWSIYSSGNCWVDIDDI